MKNNLRLIYGLIITAAIFLTATFVSREFKLGIDIIPDFFVTLTIELLFSVLVIFMINKNVEYSITVPKGGTLWKPALYAILTTIIINGTLTIIAKALGEKVEVPPMLAKLSPVQILIFVFFYASIAEEMLFHGFLMNIIKPLEVRYFTFLKRKMSLPVIISALAFASAHLIVILSGVSPLFVVRIVIFTFCLGLIAGYYQEKYNNHAYAIIVHMAGNSLAVLASLSMS